MTSRRKSGGNYRGPERGPRGVATLSGLLDAYRQLPPDESGGFARPAPPPTPPLPLKFTCRGCGGTVDVDTGVCQGTCQTNYEM